MPNYKEVAREARIKVLELIYKAQTSHIGSNFSAIDIMAVLFDKMDLKKDRFVLSAGWKAASLYYFMWKKELITEEELNSYCQEGSKFIGLSEPIHKDIPFAGGSMGFGLPAAVGFALSKKLKGEEGKVYCLMSDGEMQIGTTWESALIAVHHKLDNLFVIVDNNQFQAMGDTQKILKSKFPEYGWNSYREINGHNFKEIEYVISRFQELNTLIRPIYVYPEDWCCEEKPTIINFKTIKGKGVSFMENNNLYHYKNLSEEEYNLALKELK